MPEDAAEPALHARIRRHYHRRREQQQQKPIGRGGETEEKIKNKKKAREGVALSAAGTLHHRLWKGGRGADGGREVLLAAHSLFQCTNPNLIFIVWCL